MDEIQSPEAKVCFKSSSHLHGTECLEICMHSYKCRGWGGGVGANRKSVFLVKMQCECLTAE